MRRLLLLSLALAATGCNGPKETCEGTVKSYFSTLKSQDFEAMYPLLVPEHRAKFSSVERFQRAMGKLWEGSKDFKLGVAEISEGSNTCIARGMLKYTIKVMGSEARDYDDYVSWTLQKGKDGLWYIQLPGLEKVGAF